MMITLYYFAYKNFNMCLIRIFGMPFNVFSSSVFKQCYMVFADFHGISPKSKDFQLQQ